MFLKSVRSCISRYPNQVAAQTADGQQTQLGSHHAAAKDGYMVRDGHLYVSLWEIKKHSTGKTQPTSKQVIDSISTVRWYVDNDACLCFPGTDCAMGNGGGTDVKCNGLRTRMGSSRGRNETSYALGALFEYIGDVGNTVPGVDGDDVVGGEDGEQDGEAYSDDEGISNGQHDGQMQWMRFRFGMFNAIQYQVETLLDVVAFCSFEPVTLGFFPFLGCDIPNGSGGHASRRRNTSARNPESTGEIARASRTAGLSDGQNGTATVTSVQSNEHRGTAHGDSNSAPSRQASSAAPFVALSVDSTDADISGNVRKLAKESVELYQKVVAFLGEVATCTEDGRTPQDWVCSTCSMDLGLFSKYVSAQNSVLGRFITEILTYGESNAFFTRQVSMLVSELFRKRISAFEEYLNALSTAIQPSSLEY